MGVVGEAARGRAIDGLERNRPVGVAVAGEDEVEHGGEAGETFPGGAVADVEAEGGADGRRGSGEVGGPARVERGGEGLEDGEGSPGPAAPGGADQVCSSSEVAMEDRGRAAPRSGGAVGEGDLVTARVRPTSASGGLALGVISR